jgi:hypothetical protein
MIAPYGVYASGGIFGNQFIKGHMGESQECNKKMPLNKK